MCKGFVQCFHVSYAYMSSYYLLPYCGTMGSSIKKDPKISSPCRLSNNAVLVMNGSADCYAYVQQIHCPCQPN